MATNVMLEWWGNLHPAQQADLIIKYCKIDSIRFADICNYENISLCYYHEHNPNKIDNVSEINIVDENPEYIKNF